jgi:hypothetical protein
MAPKETKKDRERRLKKAEEQLRGAEATDAPTDGPTDDDEPEEPLLYDAEDVLMRPGTSTAAAAAAPINAVACQGERQPHILDLRFEQRRGRHAGEGQGKDWYHGYEGQESINAVVQVAQQSPQEGKEVEKGA